MLECQVNIGVNSESVTVTSYYVYYMLPASQDIKF